MNEKNTEKFLYIEIYGEKGASTEVRLNDIPACNLSAEGDNSSGNSFTQAKYYIKPGINTISVYPLSKKGKSTIRFVRYTKGEFTGRDKGEELIKIIVENSDTPVHKKIELPSDNKKLAWMHTDIITDDESKKEALEFVKKTYQYLQKNNIKEMVSALDPILSYELIFKPNTTKDKLAEEWEKGLGMAFNGDNIFDDINTISIQLIPIADGKLFQVKRKDGSMFFRTSDKNEYTVGFRDIIGRKDGVWKFYH